MQINTTIARQVVERTMKIIQYSVNVMDSTGQIIASGDPDRLHQKHDGAVLVLNSQRVVEINEATAQQLEGVKQGINLPIMFNQKVIGVVGISGKPEVVRNYGELVKMTAELIIEQAELMSKIEWDKRHREELVMQLINGSNLNDSQLMAIAERLQLDLSQPRIASIIRVQSKSGEQLTLTNLQHLIHLLENPERDNLVGITSVSMNEVVVLKPITLNKDGWSKSFEQQRVQKLLRRIEKEANYTIKIALGDYFPTLSGLSQSYLTAKATMDSVLDNENSDQQVFFYQDHILPVLLHGLKEEHWRYEQLQRPLQDLKLQDSRGTLLKTLKVFFEQNCDLAQTSERLHIHRNTLRYRLDNIEEKTGLNINKLSDITWLYLAVLSQ